jgi:hypothetical protein
MIHMYIEIGVDDGIYLYEILICYNCMLRIGCKPICANQFNMAKICSNVIEGSCCRLMNHLPLNVLSCLEVDRLIMSNQSY